MKTKATLSSIRSDWKTPRGLYQALDAEFGFDFDPCPPTAQFDGLTRDWGKVNFCNPPYNQLAKWIRKAHEQWRSGKTCVLLIPARTDTKAWHECILPDAQELRFVRGRIYFDDGGGRAPFASVIVIYSKLMKEVGS